MRRRAILRRNFLTAYPPPPPPHRYDGAEGLQDADQPTLAIGLENGRLQLMRRDTDDAPILVDTGTLAASIRWNTSGSVLAVAGNQNAAEKAVSVVLFYSPFGQHLRTLKVPGSGISACSWEGGSLRLALAVDSYIYFANIRPDYKWGAFAGTVACAYTSPERADWSVLFWAEKTDERRVKHVKRLVHVAAAGEHAVMVQAVDAPSSAGTGEMNGAGMGGPHHSVVLCSAIGAPLDTKTIEMEPKCVAMSPYHVCAASSDHIYVWQYRTLMSRLTSVDEGGGASSLRRKEGRERAFHIDDAPSATQGVEALAIAGTRGRTADPIVAVAAAPACLLVARDSGALVRYSLPHLGPEGTFQLRCRPATMHINCDTSRVAIIDANGLLTLFDLNGGVEVAVPASEPPARFERKDVWQFCWASDNPESFAVMEKTKMTLFR